MKNLTFCLSSIFMGLLTVTEAHAAKVWHHDCKVKGLNVYSWSESDEDRRSVIQALRSKDFIVEDNVPSFASVNFLRGLHIEIGSEVVISQDWRPSDRKYVFDVLNIQSWTEGGRDLYFVKNSRFHRIHSVDIQSHAIRELSAKMKLIPRCRKY